MVFCRVKLVSTDNHFIRIPQKLIKDHTILVEQVLVVKIAIEGVNHFCSVGGSSKEDDVVEIGNNNNLAWNLIAGALVHLLKPEENEIGLAERVSVAPSSPADWDVIKLNQSGIEKAVLEQIRVLEISSTIAITLHKIRLRLSVCEAVPKRAAVVLQQMTEMEILIPDYDDREEMHFSSDSEEECLPKTAEHASESISSLLLQQIRQFIPNSSTSLDNERKLLFKQYFPSEKLHQVVRVECDESIQIPTLCKLSTIGGRSPSVPERPYFARLTGQSAQDSEDESLFVKVMPDIGLLPERLYVSTALIKSKNIKVGQKILLESLALDKELFTESVDTLKVRTSKSCANLVQARFTELLKDSYNVFSSQYEFKILQNSCKILAQNNKSLTITVPGCRVVMDEESLEDSNFREVSSVPYCKTTEQLSDGIFSQELQDCYDYVLASLNVRGECNRPTHLLVTGGSGAGKTAFCSILSHRLAKCEYSVASKSINCISLKGKRLDVVKSKIKNTLAELRTFRPGVLLLDNLDVIAGLVEDDHPDETVSTLSLWIKEFLENLTSEENELLVLGTAESLDSLNPSLQPKKGSIPFLKTVNLFPLSPAERLKLTSFFLGSMPPYLNSSTLEGYQPCDIKNLCERLNSSSDKSNHTKIIESFIPISKWGKQLKPKRNKNISTVGGLFKAKENLLKTIIWPTKHQDIYDRIGVRMPRGVLLYGVPGTGKTLLAESVAAHSNLNYITVKGPELLSKYIGASERNVRDLFLRAQAAKPCLIFFDEFESLAPRRGHDSTGVTDRVVNQLLTQMDGVEGLDGVWLMAATSRPDLIDPALLRPGRIDKSVLCPMPDFDDRLDILRKLTEELSMSSNVDLTEIAGETDGFTGADLKGVLYTAIHANGERGAKDGSGKMNHPNPTLSGVINQEDLMMAVKVTDPSVTTEQLHKFNAVYENFKSGVFVAGPQRATLA